MPEPPSRKIFNCIVDDTALVAGVKRSTRNGIRHWVKNEQIRLFVPLHALDQLSRQRSANSRHGEDVRETLQWLDEATSRFPHVVTLQGAEETYPNWSEVQRFGVPRSLFSESDHIGYEEAESEDLADDTAKLTVSDAQRKGSVSSLASGTTRSLSPSSFHSGRSSVSPVSPPTSPTKAASSPAKPAASLASSAHSASSDCTVPLRLQPLFNYILWRIHQELDPVAALEAFIFLCNDPVKASFAKGFDVRYKRLEQLREAVGREDREFRNRQLVQDREKQAAAQKAFDGADDQIVLKPPPKGPAAMVGQQSNLIDPDSFGRIPQPVQQSNPAATSQQSQRFAPFNRGNGRSSMRGAPRGRGNFGAPLRGGFLDSSRGRGENASANTQIDPNSFERPRSGGFTGREGRRLWVPS